MFDILGYTEAKTLQQAFDAVKQQPNSKFISGGTDVLIKSRERKDEFIETHLIGITRIPELQGISLDKDETLCIGAVSTFNTIENNAIVKECAPNLAFAVSTVGGPQTRNAGTIGGNVCNGATSADSAATLFAYNAWLEIASEKGTKEVSIHDFYQGPGKVDLQPGEILTKVKIKKEDYAGYQGHYVKFAQRKAMDIANLSCSVNVKANNNIIEDIRIAFGVAGPTPIRATIAEDFAKGKEITDEVLAEIGEKCLESTKARDSWRASKEYREDLIRILPGRCVKIALGGK